MVGWDASGTGKKGRMDSGDGFRSPGPASEPDIAMFAERRRRLVERLGDGVAVVPSAPELLKSRDTEIGYRQSSDLYYLAGFPEPEAVAVIAARDGVAHLTLFVRPRAPEREAWTGKRIGVEAAGARFGADAVHPIGELGERLPGLLRTAGSIHYPIGTGDALEALVVGAIRSARSARPRSGVGPTALVDLDATTAGMRVVKDAHELDRMRVAARIGAAGHIAAMRRARPGVGEWELQAALEAEFRALGADGPAFPSIVGAGENATILHYTENRRRLREGDLVLIDAGAEWGMYCSDITRTFPASGRFTAAQRDLYEVVLAAEEAAIDAVRPGAPFTDVHDAAVRTLVRGFLDLGILPAGEPDGLIESGDYKRFYLHQTSHWLGIDVHDAGPYRQAGEPVKLVPGMVLTIEPGVYIPADAEGVPEEFKGVGIRIEDDVVVTEDSREVLTRGVPVEVEAVEGLLKREE